MWENPSLKKEGKHRKDAFMFDIGNKSYFINQKHVKFFMKAFPNLWQVIGCQTPISPAAFEHDMRIMKHRPNLNCLGWLFQELLLARMPHGYLVDPPPVQPGALRQWVADELVQEATGDLVQEAASQTDE